MPVTLSEITSYDKFSYLAEWFDGHILRKFIFFYFPSDGTIELYDKVRRRCFLKRTNLEGLEVRDIYVGNTLKIFNRQIKLVAYANEFTRKQMGYAMQKTFALIKPDGVKHKGNILKMFSKEFKISHLRMLRLTYDMVTSMFPEHVGTKDFLTLSAHLSSAPVIALELLGENSIERLKELAGPEDPTTARVEAPDSIRACYGADTLHNVLYCAETSEKSEMLEDFFFGKNAPPPYAAISTCVLENSTCCIIKPHAVRDGYLGDMVLAIEEEGYSITAMNMFYLEHVVAEEFYEVYKGVLQEYHEMVSELISGACVAMEVTGPMGAETPKYFRSFIGPSDPEIGRQLRPTTLRSKFGMDRIRNAVHVTDLEEDALLEVEYFFKILL